MTKDELKQIVDMVHANWNITPLPAQLQTVYKAWWSLLAEFEYDTVNNIVLHLIKQDGWTPRAGTVYRRAKDSLSTNPPQSSALAWEEYRRVAAEVDSGVWEQTVMHPVLQRCISVIGGYHLHTNADREHFIKIYDELVLKEYE